MSKEPQQLSLQFVPHAYQGHTIEQRAKDGYINATAMCQAASKNWNDYSRLNGTHAFLAELAADTGIPVSEIVQSIRGGDPYRQGTWVHPQVAIHLAQWLSAKFAVLVSKWVYEWMSGRTKTSTIPYHLRRYVTNQKNVPRGHFSVLNEIALALIAPLEVQGYTLPEHMWPDISEGKMFAKWLRDRHGVDTTAMPTYIHEFQDGRASQPAKAYPNAWLAEFRAHFENVWLPQRATDYFAERDVKALQYLPALLPAPIDDAA
jgi:hypothetical protein